jgi:hypothetical protein
LHFLLTVLPYCTHSIVCHPRFAAARRGRRRQGAARRKQIAAERKWDQLLAPALVDFGVVLAVMAIVVFCSYLLRGLRHDTHDEQVLGELLVQELVSESPVFLPSPIGATCVPLTAPRAEQLADGPPRDLVHS